MNHLRQFDVDRLAAGESIPAFATHLADCAECRARVSAARDADAELRQNARFHRVRAQLAERSSPRSFWPLWAGAAVAVTLGLWLTVQTPERAEPDTRTKGAATLHVVYPDDPQPPARFEPGRTVHLVAKTKHAHAVVLAVDNKGSVSRLWPVGSARQAVPDSGVLAPAFRVTPGNLTLLAYFADGELANQTVLDVVRRGGRGVWCDQPGVLACHLGPGRPVPRGLRLSGRPMRRLLIGLLIAAAIPGPRPPPADCHRQQ